MSRVSLRRIAAALKLELALNPNDQAAIKISRISEKRHQLPVPGERPNIRQLMNQVRIRQQQRAERVRDAIDAFIPDTPSLSM